MLSSSRLQERRKKKKAKTPEDEEDDKAINVVWDVITSVLRQERVGSVRGVSKRRPGSRPYLPTMRASQRGGTAPVVLPCANCGFVGTGDEEYIFDRGDVLGYGWMEGGKKNLGLPFMKEPHPMYRTNDNSIVIGEVMTLHEVQGLLEGGIYKVEKQARRIKFAQCLYGMTGNKEDGVLIKEYMYWSCTRR